MNVTFDWYCPHCGKRKDGGPDDYVIECMKGMKPLVYGLCKDCAIAHHRWIEGEKNTEESQRKSKLLEYAEWWDRWRVYQTRS